MADTKAFVISPDTKLFQLLKVYPQLEEKLMSLSPTFSKLKNPVLRKTIGKVATLKQIAEIGHIPISDLINVLRNDAGADLAYQSSDEPQPINSGQDFVIANPVSSLDARPLLDQGIHPVSQVLQEVENIKNDEVYELITPFTPLPLIEKIEAKGFITKTIEINSAEIRTYFRRGPN
jgi:hypothetical protein